MIEEHKTKSDKEVLALSVESPSAFELIVDRYQKPFLRTALGVLKNRESAEDVVQETFTKIYFNAARFKDQEGASFKSWAYRILLNTSFSYYKKLKRDRGATLEIDQSFYENIGDVKVDEFQKKEELRDMVASVLSRMPRHLARVLTLHYIKDMPQREIAEKEGLTVSAVKTRVHRAKKKARAEFEKLSAVVM